jgi:Tol biopolymer transport system component
MPVPGLTDADFGVRLSSDERTTYITSKRSGNLDLYQASRDIRSDPFGPATPLSSLNTLGIEAAMVVTDTGDAYFESDRDGSFRIYRATRPAVSAMFSEPAALSFGTGQDGGVSLSGDGLTLYYHSLMPDGLDLFQARLGTPPSDGVPLRTLNSPAQEGDPVVSHDGLRIFFGSDRGVRERGYDIWTATRATTSGDFEMAVPVDELNTSDHEGPTWISPDGCRLYFGRTGIGSSGAFVAEKPPLSSSR